MCPVRGRKDFEKGTESTVVWEDKKEDGEVDRMSQRHRRNGRGELEMTQRIRRGRRREGSTGVSQGVEIYGVYKDVKSSVGGIAKGS